MLFDFINSTSDCDIESLIRVSVELGQDHGDFFAIGKKQFDAACKLGMNSAVAFLVLARGTGRDNITTRWSAEAVAQHSGISWRRASHAIDLLQKAKLASNATESGKRPIRKLKFPSEPDAALWLPNALVDGVAGKASPIARLRQTQDVAWLQAFIELYGLQDLAGDGGLPRNFIWQPFRREHICDSGQFRVYGFAQEVASCRTIGPLARFKDDKEPAEGWTSWKFLSAMQRMGLLEKVDYLAEGVSPDAELIHALTGDDEARAVSDAADQAILALPDWVSNKRQRDDFDHVLPVLRDIPAPAVVGVYRLVFRPHTGLTAAWWSQHREACRRFAGVYSALAVGNYRQAIAI